MMRVHVHKASAAPQARLYDGPCGNSLEPNHHEKAFKLGCLHMAGPCMEALASSL